MTLDVDTVKNLEEQYDGLEEEYVAMEKEYFEIEKACNDIQLALDRSSALAAEEGVYAPGEWYATTKHALAAKRQESNMLARAMARKKREFKKVRSKLFGEVFIRKCQEVLDQDLFTEIMRRTREATADRCGQW